MAPSIQPPETQSTPGTSQQTATVSSSEETMSLTAVTSADTKASSTEETTTVTSAMSTDATEPMTTTEAETAPSSETTPETTTSAEMTTPKRPGLHRFTTVCTVSYLHVGLVMPPGEVCNYIFYDSLYLRPEDTFMGTFTNDYLKPFFDTARQSPTVRFGFSVHAPAVDGFTNEIRSVDGKKHYKDHWQHNIYGWGFLNIHELIVKSNPAVVKSALTVLKELEEIAVAESTNASSMVIGLYCRPQTTCDQVAEYIKTTFIPGGLVILGHLSHRDNNITDCFILGPTLKTTRGRKYENASYVHTLQDSMTAVRYLQKTHGIDTMYALSFTMAGRWYQPKHPDIHFDKAGKFRPGNLCKTGVYSQKAFVQEHKVESKTIQQQQLHPPARVAILLSRD
ncbi:uncharacterized protein LOC144110885 [Amblyomma americanum]